MLISFCRHGMSKVRLCLCVFSGGFVSYLRNRWSVNLRGIENKFKRIKLHTCTFLNI
jgi:hypothetical protein